MFFIVFRNTEVAFSHLFLQEWDVTREAPPYPPSAGPLAVYSKENFHQYLDFAIENVRISNFLFQENINTKLPLFSVY